MEEKKEKSNKKQFLFSFNKINKYYLFPFLAPIFCCLSNLSIHTIYRENQERKLYLFLTFYIDCSYLIGGLLFCISKIRNKTEETRNEAIIDKEKESKVFNVKYIYNDKSKKSKIQILLMLLLISTLISITTILNLYSMGYNCLDKRAYFILFIIILSKYILNIEIYRHQFISMFIAFIGLILNIIFLNIDESIK